MSQYEYHKKHFDRICLRVQKGKKLIYERVREIENKEQSFNEAVEKTLDEWVMRTLGIDVPTYKLLLAKARDETLQNEFGE